MIPALRRPNIARSTLEKPKRNLGEQQQIMLTLKDGKKMVVSCDTFHGIVNNGEVFKCVLCVKEMQLDNIIKEDHKRLSSHRKLIEFYPHLEELGENLVRKLDKETCYCTVCNLTISAHSLMRHISADGHTDQLNKAFIRVSAYDVK